MAKGKEKDLTEQARNTGQRMRSSAAALMEPGFAQMAPKMNARVRTQPGDAQQANAVQANIMNNSPSAMPTPYAKGGKVGKCMKCGGAAHKGMCAGGKMAKGGAAKHDDTAEDTKLFNKLYDKREKEEPKGMAKGGKKAFNPGGTPGKLHRELGIPVGQKIPSGRLASAANSSDPEIKRDAIRAQTMKKWKHASGGAINLEADEPAPMQKNKVVPGAAGAGAGVPRSKVTRLAVGGSLEKEESPSFPRNKLQKLAAGGVAKIRHGEMTKDQKQTPNKPTGWNAYK